MDFKNKMLLYVLYFVLFQTVCSQVLSETSARILKRLERLERDVVTIRKDLNEESELCRVDISTLSNRLSELSGHVVRQDKEHVAIAQHGSCECDAFVSQYKNDMNAFKGEQSENIVLRKKFDEMKKEYDFEIGNLREMLKNVVSELNSTDRTLRSEIDTIKNETMENALNREQYIASQYKNVMNAFKSEKLENMMIRKNFDEMKKTHDFEMENIREMFNNVVSGLNSTDRALGSEIETIRQETKENFSAAQKLVHDSNVVYQKEINYTRAYFNDVMLPKEFDDVRKERDFEIGKVRDMFTNAVSILNSTDKTLRSEIDTIKNETKENLSAIQKLVHDNYVACQNDINNTRSYFNYGLIRVNDTLENRSSNALHSSLVHIQRLYPNSCETVEKSGEHTIYPVSHPNGIRVYCYKDSEHRGWIVIQRRADGSVQFNRTWADYKAGFGDVSGEFWMGNENIYQLTKDEPKELRIDMETFNGTKRYAMYSKFNISPESEKYKLHLSGYSGDTGDELYRYSTHNHNGQSFSTFDADNDMYVYCCACEYGGGWWYHDGGCFTAKLNGKYYKESETVPHARGIHWRELTAYDTSLKFVTMNIR